MQAFANKNMAGQEIAITEVIKAERPVSLAPEIKRKPFVLLASAAALMCGGAELGLLEQLDSLTWYMTFREILLDSGVALLIVLGLAVLWWLCLLLLMKLIELVPSTNRHAAAVFWRFGLSIPLLYFVLDFFYAARLRFYPHWHPGIFGWLWLAPTLMLFCAFALGKAKVSQLQEFCGTRLAPIGWLHFGLGAVAIVGLGTGSVHVFRDYAHPGRTVAPSRLPDVYLITIDALRADEMPLYGYDRQTAPNLQRFAQHAFTFDFFFANSNFTTTATTSIETGKLPWTHRVFQVGGFLRDPAQQENLGALLRQHGYYTADISSNFLASPIQHRTEDSYDALQYLPARNASGTFSRYTNLVGLNTLWTLEGPLLKSIASVRQYLDALIWSKRVPSPAEPVFDEARSVLERADITQPRFIWMHILPPHDPYLAPQQYRGRFLSSPKLTHVYNFIGLHNDALPPGVSVAELRARYDEDLVYADDSVGNFLDWLDQSGRLDRSIVIVSADHGESFDHGFLKHGGPYLYNSLIRIPLLVHLPGQQRGLRIAQPAEQVDLLPTILDLVGEQVPSWSEGASLVPALEGKPLPQRMLFSMNLERNSVFESVTRGTVAVIDDDFKYIERLETHEALLYRYKTDPSEEQNLAGSEPAIAGRLRDVVANKLREVNSRTILNP